MKIIFLDIDGVLNHHEYMAKKAQPGFEYNPEIERQHHLDRESIARLNALCERTGASVVVSSMWRLIYKNAALRGILGAFGFTGKLIGSTPINNQIRGVQIAEFLESYTRARGPVESFVILDDDSDMGPLKHRLVQTSFNDGLTDVHVERAVEMLST
jgi:hypothetical protein